MLKKFFIAAMLTILLAAENFCAAMPYSEMYLGGFTVGSSYSAMVRMYGQPTQDEHVIEDICNARYGNTVEISYSNYSKKIQSIEVTANNGWKTPSGLAVGMNISRALDMYGEPDYKTSSSVKTAYCYFHRDRNYLDYGFFILFNKESGKILQLGVYGGSSMSNFDEIYQGIMTQMVK